MNDSPLEWLLRRLSYDSQCTAKPPLSTKHPNSFHKQTKCTMEVTLKKLFWKMILNLFHSTDQILYALLYLQFSNAYRRPVTWIKNLNLSKTISSYLLLKIESHQVITYTEIHWARGALWSFITGCYIYGASNSW